MIESYVLTFCYLALAIVCWFYFYHHPSHINVQIDSNESNANSYTFNVDNSNVGWTRQLVRGQDEPETSDGQNTLHQGI